MINITDTNNTGKVTIKVTLESVSDLSDLQDLHLRNEEIYFLFGNAGDLNA